MKVLRHKTERIHSLDALQALMISTTIISFATYHYLVRSTFIGKFLNGRKYLRKIADIIKLEALRSLKPALDT